MSNVTVIMTAYNPPRIDWFKEALLSIPRNRFADFILCDDGSDPPIKGAEIRHDENRGAVQSVNELVARVKTKWFAQLCCDDYFNEYGVNALLDVIDTIDADIVHFPIFMIPQNIIGMENPNVTFDMLKCENCIPGTSWVRKELFDELGGLQYHNSCEDWELWLRAARAGARFHYFKEVVYVYRTHEQTATTKWAGKFAQVKKDMEMMYGKAERDYWSNT